MFLILKRKNLYNLLEQAIEISSPNIAIRLKAKNIIAISGEKFNRKR